MTEKKKRILHLITKGNFGGAQRYVFDISTKLPKESFQVSIATGEGDELVSRCAKHNIDLHLISSLKRDISIFELRAFFEIYKLIKETKVDIIQLHSSKAGGLGAIAGRIFNLFHPQHKVSIIFTSHGWAFNDARFSPLVRSIFKILQWVTVLASHKTIAVSHAIENDIKNLPFIKSKTTVIHHGTEPVALLEQQKAREEICPENKYSFWMGTIAELTPNKGIDTALQAFTRIAPDYPDISFVVMGEGEQREELEKMIRDKNLEDRIFLCGFIKDAPRYLSALNLFTLTSRTEALGYVLLEAGNANLPVVATRVGGIPEVIENTTSGILVRPDNIRELETALRFMLDHKDERTKIARNLTQHVEETFSQDRMLKQTMNLYTTSRGE